MPSFWVFFSTFFLVFFCDCCVVCLPQRWKHSCEPILVYEHRPYSYVYVLSCIYCVCVCVCVDTIGMVGLNSAII